MTKNKGNITVTLADGSSFSYDGPDDYDPIQDVLDDILHYPDGQVPWADVVSVEVDGKQVIPPEAEE